MVLSEMSEADRILTAARNQCIQISKQEESEWPSNDARASTQRALYYDQLRAEIMRQAQLAANEARRRAPGSKYEAANYAERYAMECQAAIDAQNEQWRKDDAAKAEAAAAQKRAELATYQRLTGHR